MFSQLKTECNTNLASVTAERDSLKGKEAALKTCNINLRDVTKERDDCELELGQLQTDSTRDLEQLRNNNRQQGAKIITLEEQISGLLATNTTLTNSFNTCTSDLASSRNLIDQKDDQIDDLNSKLRASEQQNQNFEGQFQTCQAALLDAQRAKLDGYISSCNEMHARYQRYYEGATQQDLNWWEHLTEGVKKLFSWFHSRYDDTKPIWKESSLKALLCLWRNNSIVNENAMIKAKSLSGPVNTYSLDDLCNKEQLIDNLEDDILNPCGMG